MTSWPSRYQSSKLVESNVRTMLNGVSWKRADDAPVLVDALDCCSRCNIRPLNATGSDATPWDLMQPVVDIPGHGRCPALRHAEPASGPHAAPQAARVHAICRMLHQMQFCPFSSGWHTHAAANAG